MEGVISALHAPRQLHEIIPDYRRYRAGKDHWGQLWSRTCCGISFTSSAPSIYFYQDNEPWAFMGGSTNTAEFLYDHVGTPPEISVEQVDDDSMQQCPSIRIMDEAFLNRVGAIFSNGLYTVIQNFVHPRLLVKGDESNPAEYFSREQPYFTDTPYHDPGIAPTSLSTIPVQYYRCSSNNQFSIVTWQISSEADYVSTRQLIFPMQLIQDLDMTRVAYYQRQMAKGCIPTALALGRMDARNAYKFCIDNGSKALLPMSTVTLQSFLIDGHHKLYAAATMQDKYGKVGCCSLLSFIYEKKAVVGLDCDLQSYGDLLSVLRNLAEVPVHPPPPLYLISDPTCSVSLPTQPPFRVVMCNLPSPVTREQIIQWWELAQRYRRPEDRVLVKDIEIPGSGTAGYAFVEVGSYGEMKNALLFARHKSFKERILWISVAGAERLTKEGKCAIADWVDNKRGFARYPSSFVCY